jgi:hypothetical protein
MNALFASKGPLRDAVVVALVCLPAESASGDADYTNLGIADMYCLAAVYEKRDGIP